MIGIMKICGIPMPTIIFLSLLNEFLVWKWTFIDGVHIIIIVLCINILHPNSNCYIDDFTSYLVRWINLHIYCRCTYLIHFNQSSKRLKMLHFVTARLYFIFSVQKSSIFFLVSWIEPMMSSTDKWVRGHLATRLSEPSPNESRTFELTDIHKPWLPFMSSSFSNSLDYFFPKE